MQSPIFMDDNSMKEYFTLAKQNEDLKSKERILATAMDNLNEIKALLLEKEKEFCSADQELRASSYNNRTSVKDSLRKRCFNLIEHLFHYKCVVECLSGDLRSMDGALVNDDEYIHLSLMHRYAELEIMKSITSNQTRNEDFAAMHEEETQKYLAKAEDDWRLEHQQRRKLISQLILDQNQFFVDKATKNLEQQQSLLNQRYQSINNLIKMSYNHIRDGNNNYR